MTKVSITTLLDAGAHFGHQTRRWNPKMKPYIFGNRGDIYIIDLKQTLYGLDAAYTFVSNLTRKGGTVLFVGTKKQAQEAVSEAANRCGMPYVNARWLGGMLTNFATIRTRVKRMEELEAMDADGRMALLPKKEQILLHKELGIGPRLVERSTVGRQMYDTLPYQAIGARIVSETKAEEMRVLYVAMTRAREKLILTGTLSAAKWEKQAARYARSPIRSVRLLADFMADAVIAGTGADVTAAEMAGEAAAADAVAEVAVEAAADVAEGAGAEVVADVVADAE